MVRNISTASEYGITYSNSVRVAPRLRLFSVIVAADSLYARARAEWELGTLADG
jgi:hypothetical protein